MSVTVQWNLTEYNATLKELILELGIETAKGVAQEARLFLETCIKLTPPRGRGAMTETYNSQKRQGEAAVAANMGRALKLLDDLAIVRESTRVGNYVRKYMQQGNYAAINTILRDIGADVELLTAVDETIVDSLRNKRGRIPKGVRKFIIQAQTIQRVIRLKISHVGRAKAGWIKAADGLKLRVPGWIDRHKGQPGIFENDLNNRRAPSVTVGNAVEWIQEAGANLKVIQDAIQQRIGRMKVRMESAVNYVHRKHSAHG